ncbi:MAG: ATP-binding domain-containing protein, partial [Deltaproteobacteria bacterium]|nr:ATP-binding domain-containing protein [Deltaproteobacteria bacterium]
AANPFFACGSLQPAAPEGRPVEYVTAARLEELEREVARVLHRLIRDELVPAEHVAVLTGRPASFLGRSGRIGAFECARAVERGKVVLSSVADFKGLESRVSVLTDLEEALDEPELLYVALTRARAHLVIVATGEAIASLRARRPGELVCRACT